MTTVFSGGRQQQTQAPWPTADVDRLKDLWGRGWSAASISEDMPRYTRNGIIGKIHRLKLTRSPTAAKKDKPRSDRRTGVKRAVLPKPIEIVYEPAPLNGLSLFDLTNSTCRWPISAFGTSTDFHFCGAGGADLIASRPYCREHTRMARKQ